MSATMARQGGQVQLEQSNMHLALNMAKMAKEGFLCAAIEAMRQLLKQPCADVREEMKHGVECNGHRKVNVAIERHLVMVRGNLTEGCLSRKNGTANNPERHWTHKGTSAPPSGPVPPPPRTPTAPPGDSVGTQCSTIGAVPARYVYIHTPLPNHQLFNVDADAKNRKHDKYCIHDLQADEVPAST